MKKLTLLFAAVLISSISFAQEQGTFRGQASLVYGDDSELGLDFGVQYFVSEQIALAPSYSFFFKEIDGNKLSSLNLEGRYYFNENLYGLAGFDILNGANSNTEIALGAGYDVELNSGTLVNFQAKYAEQIVLGAGIVFSF